MIDALSSEAEHSSLSDHYDDEDFLEEESVSEANDTPFAEEKPDMVTDLLISYPSINFEIEYALNEADRSFLGKIREDFRNIENYNMQFFSGLMNMLPSTKLLDKELHFYEEIEQIIVEEISLSRNVFPQHTSYHFNQAILGPRYSGKSTILSVFLKVVLAEILASKTSNKQFIMPIDGILLSESLVSFDSFCKEYITLIFTALTYHIGIGKYQKRLISHFLGIIQGKNLTVPQIPTMEEFFESEVSLSEISLILHRLKATEDSDLLSHIVSLSTSIPAAFGFKKTHFVIDNFEYLDRELDFNSETHSTIDLFQKSMESYIISCQSADLFLESVFISPNYTLTTGLITEFEYNNYSISIRFDGEPRPFLLTPTHCSGCPAFLSTFQSIILSEYPDIQKTALNSFLNVIFPASQFKDKSIRLVDINSSIEN